MRLTEKTQKGYALDRNLLCPGKSAVLISKNITNKLGQLEDIEEELGIDLLTLIKVLNAVLRKEYLWTKYNDKLCATDDVVFGDEYNGVLFIYFYWNNGKHLVFELKDYGKTWALTKEELL